MPAPLATSAGSSARVTSSVPMTLTSYMCRQSSGLLDGDVVGADRAAGVVEQQVERRADGLGERGDLRLVGHVAGDRGAADLAGECLDALGASGDAEDVISGLGEGACGGGADAAAGPGDDGGGHDVMVSDGHAGSGWASGETMEPKGG